MTSRQLIRRSIIHLKHTRTPEPRLINLFHTGARWMYDRMLELQPGDNRPFDPTPNYTGYGLLKYGTCTVATILSMVPLSKYGLLLIPLSIGVFYLIEIHTLFLFPLLIDRAKNPLHASIKATYNLGIGKCFITVIPIAGYMLLGLFRLTNPLRNWYIGCLAIVIWYNNEIRDKL
jgi:hypothetical protein